ncbi:hypothetical protein [Fictibacillus fluitans]|uniref:Uncharacterized protein n=1 Tax=Fictibacillus fluitans TaxID=3058422 RepID=A0ABT8HUJ5_9BACL|nr:hypothetical protein [Fictibacillus sp. NE201]MDN4524404.1 hypothetical protein [Fictibacillus sp. NE201]
MTKLEFIASLVKSLVWPVAIVWIANKFKEPITDILKRAKSITVPGVGAGIDLGPKIEEVNERLDEQLQGKRLDPPMTASDHYSTVSDSLDEYYYKVAEASPLSAMSLAWGDIEREIVRTVGKLGEYPIDGYNMVTNLRNLVDSGYLAEDTFIEAVKLRDIQNAMSNRRANPTMAQAMRYVTACQKIIVILQNIVRSNVVRSSDDY